MTDFVRPEFGTRLQEPDNLRGYSARVPCESGTLDWYMRWSYQFETADNEITYVNQHYELSMRSPVPSTNGVFRLEKRPVGSNAGCAFIAIDSESPENFETD